MEFRGNLPSAEPSLTDWEWIRQQIAADAQVPYDPNDPDDGPYDPNDDEAVDRFLTEANRVYPEKMAEILKMAKAS